jgi:uncharacterized cupredoxin-like copper-binding protein
MFTESMDMGAIMCENAIRRRSSDLQRDPTPQPRAGVRAVAAIALLMSAGWGCADAVASGARATAPAAGIRIVATDGVFEAPHRVAAGLRHIVFENHGKHQHEAMLVKLPEGMTPEGYFAAVHGGSTFPEGALDYSGAGLTAPGESVEIWVRIDPGNYMVVCWNGNHPTARFAHRLTAVADGTPDDPAPKEDVVLRLADYHFELDRAIEKGQRVIRVETPGPSMHEVDIFRMRGDASIADLERWYEEEDHDRPHARPTPADGMGGMSDSHDIHRVGWMRRNFAPGRYVFTCHLPLPRAGKDGPKLSHADAGMIKEVVVAP